MGANLKNKIVLVTIPFRGHWGLYSQLAEQWVQGMKGDYLLM